MDPSAREEIVYPAQVKGGGETVAAYAERWLPGHELSGHAREVYAWMVKRYIVPALGAKAVAECDARVVAAWLRGLEAEGKKPPLMAKIKTVATALFQSAAEDGLIPQNSVRGIKLKRQSKKRRKAFAHDEYDKLLIELGDHWHLLCDLITETGVRWEEAQALQKADLEGHVLWVGSVLNELTSPHRWQYLDRTKTGDGRQIKVRPALAIRADQRHYYRSGAARLLRLIATDKVRTLTRGRALITARNPQ